MAAPSTTGLLGYAQPLSVNPGQTLALHISSNGPDTCDIEICRMVCGDPDPAGPGQVFEAMPWGRVTQHPVSFQPVNAGSYAIVQSRFPEISDGTITIEFGLWATRLTPERQTLFSWRTHGTTSNVSATIIALNPHGQLEVALDEKVALVLPEPVLLRHWYRVSLRIDRATDTASLNATLHRALAGMSASQSVDGPAGNWSAPTDEAMLLFAADFSHRDGSRLFTTRHFNGKLESPAIGVGDARVTYAHWDFSQGIASARVVDTGPAHLNGEVRNLPMRAATGSNWDGSAQSWREMPSHYGAIHFHDDDLADCEWAASHTIDVPADARSGFYFARMTALGTQSDIAFFVAASTGEPKAPLLFIASTATYQSYANTHIKFDSLNTENLYEAVTQISEDELYLNEHRELGLSHYDTHSDDSGVAYVSSRRPMLNMRPGLYTFNYLNDTHILKWLEDQGFAYDVITDEDLHCHGLQLLKSYRVVMTGSHPEYYSTPMWDAIDAFQNAGGRHMVMGGNGFYWRIAYSDLFPGVVENRRGIAGVRTWEGEPGEHHLSFTGEQGGLWRSLGRAPQSLVGVGFSSTLFVNSTYYVRAPASYQPNVSFIFDGVEESTIGDFGYRGGGAVGMEIDRWDADLGSPPGSVVLASSVGVGLGGLLTGEEFITTTRALDGLQNGKVRADMVFFQTPNGGAVFSTGSIAWATSLLWRDGQNNVSRISANVLRRFLDPSDF